MEEVKFKVDLPGITFSLEKDWVLKIKPEGIIIWNSQKGEIAIDDKPLLAIALLDTINRLSGKHYDLSLIDQDLNRKYLKFLDSYEHKGEINVSINSKR